MLSIILFFLCGISLVQSNIKVPEKEVGLTRFFRLFSREGPSLLVPERVMEQIPKLSSAVNEGSTQFRLDCSFEVLSQMVNFLSSRTLNLVIENVLDIYVTSISLEIDPLTTVAAEFMYQDMYSYLNQDQKIEFLMHVPLMPFLPHIEPKEWQDLRMNDGLKPFLDALPLVQSVDQLKEHCQDMVLYRSTQSFIHLPDMKIVEPSFPCLKHLSDLTSKMNPLPKVRAVFYQFKPSFIEFDRILATGEFGLNFFHSLEFHDFTAYQLSKISRLTRLTFLKFVHCVSIAPETYESLPLLKTLIFIGGSNSLMFWNQLPLLERFEIHEQTMTNMPPLMLPHLKLLNLSDNAIRNLKFLEYSFLPRLARIDLRNNQIRHVQYLNRLPLLQHADVSNNPVRKMSSISLPHFQTLTLSSVWSLKLRHSLKSYLSFGTIIWKD